MATSFGKILRATLVLACCILMPYLTAQAASSPASSLSVIYDFTGQEGDGAFPYSSAAVNSSGVLFGTTEYGGTSGYGTVFALTPPAGGGPWTESVLYSFAGGSDGAYPYASLIIGSGGVLYGTTVYGGTSGLGTVFSLTPPAGGIGPWTETVLYNFTGRDGANPYASLTLGTGGVIYGTTELGGTFYAGTVFQLNAPSAPGGAWTETVLYNFTNGNDGGFPYGGVAIGSNGILYGTTNFGGASGVYGTVYGLIPPTSGGAWTETTIYSFKGGTDGGNPFAMLTIGSSGVLYGTTAGGIGGGYGTVFKLSPKTGGGFTESVLYVFTGSKDGGHARGCLSIGTGGVLYGTTFAGGIAASYSGYGVVFELTPTTGGKPWTETVLHTFTGGGDGGYPSSALVLAPSGNYYATTLIGGTSRHGTVFGLAP